MASVPAIKLQSVQAASSMDSLRGAANSKRPFSEVMSSQSIMSPGDNAIQRATEGVFGNLEAGRKRLDEIISQARAGRTFKPVELLAMQAEVNSIGEQMALSQKVVSEGISSVKRLWSMQV